MQHSPQRSWRPFALGLGSFLLIVLAFLAVGHFANAAITIENVGGTLGLGSADLKQTIVNILKWALGLLGLVAIIVMLYGGFLWLTSRGDEKKIDKAKRVLINGAIGLVIILVSWAIVLFIQRFITNATNSASAAECGPAVGIPFGTYACVDCVPSPPGDPNNGKFISNGSCIPPTETETWSALNEVPAVGATNVSLCRQAAEVFGNLNKPTDNNASAGTYTVNEVSSGTNLPGTTFLGSDHTASFMHTQDFKPNTEYEVSRAGFLSSSTPPLPLTLPPQWRFTTGTEGDDTPPTVSVVAPTGTINCLKPELDAVFSEPMLPLSVNVDNITISPTPSTGAKLTSIVMNGSMDGFTASFDKPLDPSVTYTVTLNANTDTAIIDSSTGGKYIKGFKDMCVKNALDGNANGTAESGDGLPNSVPPDDDYSWTFTTANTTTIDCTPKISSIEPTAYYGNTIGNPQQALTITGENFGVTGSGVLFPGTSAFATTASGVGSSCFNSATMPSGYRPKQLGSVACIRPADWTSTQITTLVPAGLTPSVSSLGPVTGGAVDGPVIVQKTQNSPPSNAVDIQTPHIDWVSPDNGKEGTFITISGTHFGNTAGNVYFRRTDGTQVSGSVPACAGTNGWTEDPITKASQIVVQVPAGFTAGDLADIQVAHSTLPNAAGRSNLYRFTMNNQTHPGLCSIVPQCHNTGGGMLTATGEGFGSDITQLTSLYIPSDSTKPVTNGSLGNFNSSAGTIESTAQAAIGNDFYRFQMRVGTDATNPLDYKIPCLPAPAVVQDASCNPNTGVMPSPNPVPNATNICPNISVEARFNQPMRLADLSNVANVQVSKCNDLDTFDCSSPTPMLVSSINPGSDTVWYGFGSNFVKNTWYQVTLRGANLHSQSTGVAIGADFAWHFRVRTDPADCTTDAVSISPPSAGPKSTADVTDFNASPIRNSCEILRNAASFTWKTSDITLAPLTTITSNPPYINDHLQTVVPNGANNGTATLTATTGGKSGTAQLIVQRNYCETNNDCATRTNSYGATCTGAVCNVAQRTCEPLVLDLQSGTQTNKFVNGPMGNIINVRGCYFGAGKGANGKVTFTNGSTVNGSFAICGPAGWTNDSIRVQTMPDTDPPASPNSIWGVQVVADSTLQSNNDATYTISAQCSKPDGGTTGIPGSGMPILCNISQPTGREGDAITYGGDKFIAGPGNSEAFFTQASDSATQIRNLGTPTTNNAPKSLTSHVPGGTAIPQPPATTARTTVGVLESPGNYCIATPVDFAVSCVQNSECSTGCCTGSPNGTCKTTSTCYGLIASASPAAGTLACRNSTFRVDFTELMQTSTLNSSTAYLYDTTNPGVAIPARLDVGTNWIVLTPNSALPNATYRIFVQGGKGGVTSATGRLLDANFIWPVPNAVYTVDASSTLCKIARVEIQPASDLFTCSGDNCVDDVQPTPPGPAGNQHQYTVAAYDAGNRPLGLQAWTWTQGDSGGTGGPTNVYTQGAAGSVCPGNATSSVYCSQSLNVSSGNELLTVDVVGTGGTGTASMNVRSFLCAKPWPVAPDPFPFRDPPRTAAPANPTHNFTFAFCTDDLQGASLSDPVQSPFLAGESALNKEYFMFVEDKTGNRTGDTIGIRIFGSGTNGYTTDLSPKRWYKQRFGKESTGTTLEVDGYPALREGRTVYVVADNYLANGNSYPNVYVISYNDKARSETVSIFDQVLKNIKFNDFTPGLPSTLLANLRADVKRIHAMQELVFGLADYYAVHKVNPPLDTGSYIKNMSFTSWPSWQQSLGSTLGITMPQDPEVLWKPSATLCGTGFDQTTCWNEVGKMMQFPSRGITPADSHGFAYKYIPGPPPSVQLYGTGSPHIYGHITTLIDVINPNVSICPSSPAGNSCLGFNFGMNSINFGTMSGWRLPSAVDKTAPNVAIELPLAGNIAGAVTFVVAASDETGGSGMQRVDAKIMRGTTLIASTSLGAPDKDGKYRWTWNSRSALNSPPFYTLMVTATDRAGNTSSPTQNRDYTVNNPPGDSEPPIITASAQPGQWDGSTDVTLTASATDQHTLPVNNTGVAKIEFYLGSSKLGEGLNPTCTPTCSTMFSTSVTVPVATIKGFPNGSYTYSVVAYDGFGNTSVKNATVIIGKSTGESVPPSVVIIQPTGTVSGANTDVVATASDTSGIDRVEFFIDGGFRVADFSGPYSFSWLLTGYADNSSHTIRAVAYDRYGNQATATQVVTYTIVTGPDTQRPTITDVTATLDTGAVVPMDGAQLKNTVTLNATLTDNVAMQKTELRIDGVKIPLIGSAYTCSSPQVCTLAYLWDTLPEIVGQHTVSITAYDTSNYATTVTQTVNVINQVIMSISSPQNGSTVKDLPGTGTCAITKSRTCTTSKDCPMTAIGTCDQNPGSKCLGDAACPAPGDFCVGPHEACNISPAGVPVVIDVTRTCRADQLLSSVQFFLDSNMTPLPGSATCTNGRCTYAWDSKATSSNSSHTLTAKGQDSLGCKGGAKSTVMVNNSVTDTTPPVIDSFQFGAQTWGSSQPKYINSTNRSGNISVLAHDPAGGSGLAQITIAINGTTVETCTTSPCLHFWSPADGANYTVTVGASDAIGNSAPDQSQVVNVDTTPPTASWLSPADGSTVNSPPNITLSANATDPTNNGYASGIASILFSENGAQWFDTPTQNGTTWSVTELLNAGTNAYNAQVTDRAGNTFTTPDVTLVVIGLDTRAPWVVIDTPYDGYVSGTFNPIARGGDWGGTGIRDVQFYLDGALLGSPVLPPSPFFSTASVNTTTMTQGSAHTIYAVACDKATPTNNCTTSGTVTFLVNNAGGTNCGPLICSGATPDCCGGPPYVCQAPNSMCSYGGGSF